MTFALCCRRNWSNMWRRLDLHARQTHDRANHGCNVSSSSMQQACEHSWHVRKGLRAGMAGVTAGSYPRFRQAKHVEATAQVLAQQCRTCVPRFLSTCSQSATCCQGLLGQTQPSISSCLTDPPVQRLHRQHVHRLCSIALGASRTQHRMQCASREGRRIRLASLYHAGPDAQSSWRCCCSHECCSSKSQCEVSGQTHGLTFAALLPSMTCLTVMRPLVSLCSSRIVPRSSSADMESLQSTWFIEQCSAVPPEGHQILQPKILGHGICAHCN